MIDTAPSVISTLLRPNLLPQKGVAIPKFDLESIWEAVKFTPHSGQRDIFNGWKVHEVTTAVCGTRFGKSELAAHLPLAHIAPCSREVFRDGKRIYVDHRTNGAVIAPFFRLTSIIMDKLFESVLKLCRLLGYPTTKTRRTKYYDVDDAINDATGDIEAEPGILSVRRVNGVIQTIITPWGNRIDAFTMENPKGLLGQAFDWIITDESGQFQTKEWNNYFEYADRARLDRKGWVAHVTTPKGFNDLYDKFFVPGQPGAQRNGDYISFQMPTSRNTHLDQDWLEKMRKTTPPRLWAMNYMAQFTVLEGQVYEEFSKDTHVREFKTSPDWLYFLSMDFGFTDPFASQLVAWTGEAFAVIDEVYQPGLTTAEQKKLVMAMVARHVPRGAEWLAGKDGRITTWGDPRGGQYRAEWAALGMPVRKPAVRIKGQRSEIEATSQIVAGYMHPQEDRPYPVWARRPGDGLNSPGLFVHERCVHTIHSLSSWVKLENGYDGPDHLCFVAGTPIATPGGQRAIETLRVGERVKTRSGTRRVTAARMTANDAEIWTLTTSDGRVLRGTGNHPIYATGRGFVRMDALNPGDELICQPLKPSFTAASLFGATQTRPTSPIGTITAPTASWGEAACKAFTVKSTCAKLALSQTAGMFTTGTATPAITIPSTLNVCPPPPTTGYMPSSGQREALSIWPTPANWLRRGIEALKGWPGMLKTAGASGTAGYFSATTASSAGNHTKPGTLPLPAFVPTPANQPGGGPLGWMMNSVRAWFAKVHSPVVGIPAAEPVRVLAVENSGVRAAVYNITVEGDHEYFACGILTHNCDSLRYSLVGARPFAIPLERLEQRRRYEARQDAPQRGKRIRTRTLRDKAGKKLEIGIG